MCGACLQVYQAYCRQVQATVAVKRLNLDAPCDLASLTREAALMRRFQHQHVLRLYTSFVVGRELWMVMQLMDLGSVRSIMRRAFPQVSSRLFFFGSRLDQACIQLNTQGCLGAFPPLSCKRLSLRHAAYKYSMNCVSVSAAGL